MDAITKHKHLSLTGEASQKDVEYKIQVTTDDAAKTIRIRDNGLGMSGDDGYFSFFVNAHSSIPPVQKCKLNVCTPTEKFMPNRGFQLETQVRKCSVDPKFNPEGKKTMFPFETYSVTKR